jgi:hypothetical protein
MATMLHLELTKQATPLDLGRHADLVPELTRLTSLPLGSADVPLFGFRGRPAGRLVEKWAIRGGRGTE